MTVALKTGVQLHGMTPEILLAIQVADGVYAERGYETIITSVCDGRHSRGSLHYVGMAVDLRTRHLDVDDRLKITESIKTRLGAEFDVVLESNHVHIEFQPK